MHLVDRYPSCMRIFLLGFMGSGKTTLGKQLSGLMGLPFIDLDERIESAAGATIGDIFKRKGEDFFRKIEAVRLREIIAAEENMILACGGGTPCYHDNITFINASGISIWLNTPKEIMSERLIKESGHRPLINGLSSTQLEEFIEDRLEQRLAYYSQAKFIFNPAAESLDELVKQLNNHV
jgi:shikimate kinase